MATKKENRKAIEINKTKFYDSLERRGLKLTHCSVEMGFGRSTLGMAVATGRITPTQSILLEKLYGIKKEEYEAIEETKKKKPESKADMNDFYKTIYTAVYNAMKQAWKES